ncbi:hypothetical protein [Citricoccus nitrophenolicus]|uniref:hypothetical protein n=1 Tax=Citricoccus nitrophenolicus TaxID=863575 RepID=UPI0031E622E8
MPAAVIESVIDRFKAPSMSGEKAEQFAEALQDLSVEYEARKAAVVKNSEGRKQAAQDAYEEALATSDTMQVLDSLAKDINTDKLRAVRRARAEKELTAALANDDDMGAELAHVDEWVMAELPGLLVDFGFKEAGKDRDLAPAKTSKVSAVDNDAEVRAAVASSRKDSMGDTLLMATDPDVSVRLQVARHLKAKEITNKEGEVLSREWPYEMFRLSMDADASVRAEVATLKHLPEKVVLTLMEDPEAEVRAALAAGASATGETYRILAKDRDASVRRIVARRTSNSAVLQLLAGDSDPSVRLKVADNPWTTSDIALNVLVHDDDVKVRQALAAGTKNSSVVEALVKDKDFRVRKALVGNKETSSFALHSLLGTSDKDFDTSVRMAIRKRRRRQMWSALRAAFTGVLILLTGSLIDRFSESHVGESRPEGEQYAHLEPWRAEYLTAMEEDFMSSVESLLDIAANVVNVAGWATLIVAGTAGFLMLNRWWVQSIRFREIEQ